MKRLMVRITLLLLLFFPSVGVAQFTIPAKPQKQTSVYDYADLLDEFDEKALTEKLLYYADSTSNQIVIVTVKTIEGENIGLLTPKWGHEWGVGQGDKDNGVFILVTEKERSVWISPGYGLEDKLAAHRLGEIVRNIIIPEFTDGGYYSGLDKGTDLIIGLIGDKYTADHTFENEESSVMGQLEKAVPGLIILGIVALFCGFILFIIYLIGKMFKGGYKPPKSSGFNFGGNKVPPVSRSAKGFKGGFGGGGFSGGGAGGRW